MNSVGLSASWAPHVGWTLPAAQRVYAAFFLYAFSLGGLFPRMGEIQQRMGVREGALEIVVNVDADRAAPRKLNDAPT